MASSSKTSFGLRVRRVFMRFCLYFIGDLPVCFLKNFPNGEEAYEAIFEERSVQEVIEIAFEENDGDVILL